MGQIICSLIRSASDILARGSMGQILCNFLRFVFGVKKDEVLPEPHESIRKGLQTLLPTSLPEPDSSSDESNPAGFSVLIPSLGSALQMYDSIANELQHEQKQSLLNSQECLYSYSDSNAHTAGVLEHKILISSPPLESPSSSSTDTECDFQHDVLIDVPSLNMPGKQCSNGLVNLSSLRDEFLEVTEEDTQITFSPSGLNSKFPREGYQVEENERNGNSRTRNVPQQERLISSPPPWEPISSSSTESKSEHDVLVSIPSFNFPSYTCCNALLDLSVIVKSIEVAAEKRIPVSVSELNSKGPREEEQQKEEETLKRIVVTKERWIKYYSSCQKILLVGDGDFSFSACLAVAFCSATNMVATSLDSLGFLKKNYNNAMSNIEKLTCRGGKVMHGVDATEMANNGLFENKKFDRIVYNFPLAGFFLKDSRESQLRRNRRLVGQFLENARQMIAGEGEIHITHKCWGFFLDWELEELASMHGLRLIEEIKFDLTDYPGYSTKYGFGGNGAFDCNPSKTYKFGLKRTSKTKIQLLS